MSALKIFIYAISACMGWAIGTVLMFILTVLLLVGIIYSFFGIYYGCKKIKNLFRKIEIFFKNWRIKK